MEKEILVKENQKVYSEKEIEEYLNLYGIAKKLTPYEKMQFIRTCQYLKLNPFKKELYVNKYNMKDGTSVCSLIVAYQVYLQRALKTGLISASISL